MTFKFADLSIKNIKNFLAKHEVASSEAEKLGEQLEVPPSQIRSFISSRNSRDWDGILTDVLQYWLNNDLNQSWVKLGEALHCCGHKVAAMNLGVSEQVNEEIQQMPSPEESIVTGTINNEEAQLVSSTEELIITGKMSTFIIYLITKIQTNFSQYG